MANAVVLDYPSAHSSVCPVVRPFSQLSSSFSLSLTLDLFLRRATLENFCACHVQPVQLWQSPSAVPSSSYSLKATNPAQCTCCRSIPPSSALHLCRAQLWPGLACFLSGCSVSGNEKSNRTTHNGKSRQAARRGERMEWNGMGSKTEWNEMEWNVGTVKCCGLQRTA